MKIRYLVYYSFVCRSFDNWKETASFIKYLLDTDQNVKEVRKEYYGV